MVIKKNKNKKKNNKKKNIFIDANVMNIFESFSFISLVASEEKILKFFFFFFFSILSFGAMATNEN